MTVNNLGCIPSPWDARNLKFAVRAPSFAEAAALPEEYTGLVDHVGCLGSQGNVGSCTGWAGAGLTRTLIKLNDKKDILPSPGWIYVKSRAYCEPPLPAEQDGSYPIAVLKLLQKQGAATEECSPTDRIAPYDLTECPDSLAIAAQYKIGSYHSVPTDPGSMKAAIYGVTYTQPYKMPDGSPGKCPLYVAVPVYVGFYNAKNGVVTMPAPDDSLFGYHAVIIVGWVNIAGASYWIVVNSWGLESGDNGIYYLPVGYPITEAWMVTDDAPIPNPEPGPAPVPPPGPTPSPCKWGNGVASAMNVVFLQKVRGRKGRFTYTNP